MFVRLGHVGVVAHSWEEAGAVLVETLGFSRDGVRMSLPDGNHSAPRNSCLSGRRRRRADRRQCQRWAG